LKYLAVLIALAVAARSQPYQTPTIDENGAIPASFDGAESLVSGATPGRVLWVHGICRHDDQWVQNRAAMLAAALGRATYPEILAHAHGETAWSDDVEFTLPDGKGRLDASFFIWSNLAERYRDQLAYDANVGATRASLNGDLKTNLMDTCLIDAIVYSGKNGDPFRQAMRLSVCQSLGGEIDAAGRCDLAAAPEPRKIAFVTESIGSKILFDALRALWSAASPDTAAPASLNKGTTRAALAQRLAQVSVIYMAANQIPLLDQASPVLKTMSPIRPASTHWASC
jgi:hypothetical protein